MSAHSQPQAETETPQAIAIVAAGSAAAIESAKQVHADGLAEPVLVGREDVIRDLAAKNGWDLADIRVVDANDDAAAASAAVRLARMGEVSSLMKGNLHTDVLMRAVLDKATGLRAGKRMTHVFHMDIPGRERGLLITDAAVNVSPDAATRRDIVLNAVSLAHAIGWEKPRVALLSATEDVIASMPSSVAAAETVDTLKAEGISGFEICGPLALDNAISPEAARMKGIDNPVAGHADILVVPNIETGNALFKLMVHWMDAVAAGVVLGASVPIVLTSRADPVAARVASVALAGRMAKFMEAASSP